MSRSRVQLLDEAADEVREAHAWYARTTPGREKQFLAAFRECVRSIEQNPALYPVVLGTARRALLKKFPYAVYYGIFGQTVLVLACYHLRRDPKQLRDRL